MKLSVSAFRAQASAQRKILSSYQNQLNYGTCTSFPTLGGFKLEEKHEMMVDSSGTKAAVNAERSSEDLERDLGNSESSTTNNEEKGANEEISPSEKSPGRPRSKSNQRWMKLRTTVQLSGAISTNQKSKAPLKREDSFLKRFSTRQIPETQETVDTGDETETQNGSQTQNEVNRRRRRKRKENSRTVVNPDENFYFYWLMTVTVCVLYNLWTLIVRQSFPELQKLASTFWYFGDGFADVVFICDIAVQFRTGYLEQGLMVYNSKKLASHYLKSRAFILDVLSVLPLDFLQLNVGVNPILRFPRFFKIYRVYGYYYMVESRTVYPNLWRVVNLIHILLILAHWFGCFYYLLSEAEGFQGHWVYPYRSGDYATLTRKYLGSLYWSTLTLTTIGDLPTPETNAESRGRSKAMTASGHSDGVPRRGHKSRLLQFNSNYGYLFTIVSYLIGVFIFATIVGQVGNVITNRNANRLEFERLLDGAKTYMRHHKVPGGMKRRVLRWYDYSWSRGRIQGGGDINTALGLLPDKLKTELALHVNLSVLKKVTIFQECQPEFLHDLVLKMKAYIFTPGDLICRKGEVAREMFIIADGILDVISETGRVLTTMKAGDFFGEIGILNLDGLNKRTADVRSVGYSELFSLSRQVLFWEDVLTAMKDYPEAQEILQSLGRKRLMEAKNASKMHKAQIKQNKDPDSSGESDTPGKRIVEKLRSDVRGLKNALRRSRRGTRTAEDAEKLEEKSGRKHLSEKHSVLRRMSHVQSSDEYDGGNENDHSPIGAGLPLLQRLKLLKEKQEKEREEKEKTKCVQGKKDEGFEPGTVGTALPFTQKLKLLKHKEVKESSGSGSSVISTTVRTQVTGVRFEKATFKSKPSNATKEEAEEAVKKKTREKGIERNERNEKKDPTDSGIFFIKDRLKLVQETPVKEKPCSLKTLQETETEKSSNLTSDSQKGTSNNVPLAVEAENPVPKLVGNKSEVPKRRDGWILLKKSSISSFSSNDKLKIQGSSQVSKKLTYISKSDTVLEKQKTVEKEEEKRSRSVSPVRCPKSPKKTLKETVEHILKEKKSPRAKERELSAESGNLPNVNYWELPESWPQEVPIKSKNDKKIKKYNSISDLSPEYSGLPFVKKLKILNERQKLEELEKELLVRSASLDVPKSPTESRTKVLVRSQSEAGACERKPGAGPTEEYGVRQPPDHFSSFSRGNREEERHGVRLRSENSLTSPENDETLERRHLKSILKKLSAEDSTSDEEQGSMKYKRKEENAEMKKLLRAPTVEGYVARHKKLTKSVTFDSDTLPSSPEAVQQCSFDDAKGKGFAPMSPTAILTLQLSNLSMIPIASPKKTGLKEEGCGEVDSTTPESRKESFVEEFAFKNLPTLSFKKSLDEEFFKEILRIFHQILEEVQSKSQCRFESLQAEVKKRDEIIAELQSKILDLELKNCNEKEKSWSLKENFKGANKDTNSEASGTVFGTKSLMGLPTRADTKSTFKEIPPDFLSCSTCKCREVEDPALRQWAIQSESSDQVTDEELELAEAAQFFESDLGGGKTPTAIWKNSDNLGGKCSREKKPEKDSAKVYGENRAKSSFLSRVSELHRSFSCSRSKAPDFVALDIDDSSNSSDVDNFGDKNWEVEMLVEELSKKNPNWAEAEENDTNSNSVKEMQTEVSALKEKLSDSEISRLTSSEVKFLESLIRAKDEKLSVLAKSVSLDGDEGRSGQNRPERICCSSSETRLRKTVDNKTITSLRRKIGQALSLETESEVGKASSAELFKSKTFRLKKQKTISGSCRDHRSFYQLWSNSSRLRSRVLEESDLFVENLDVGSASATIARSSLPILTNSSFAKKSTNFRASLPVLSAKELQLCSTERSTASVLESDLKKCQNSYEAPSLADQNRTSSPGLNNFIKSVSCKMKQVVTGEANTAKAQVPTISKLCDEKSSPKESGSVEEVSSEDGGVSNENDP